MISQLAGLSCSLLWALCSLAFAYAGRRVGAPAVNQLRIHMALATLIGLHFAMYGELWPPAVSDRQMTLLLVSGFIGLSLGDLCLFQCMAMIGPRLGTLLMATAPLITVAIGWLFLGEQLGVIQLLGIAVVTAGVALVLSDRTGEEGWRAKGDGPRIPTLAVLLGLGGALGQAIGLVFSRSALHPESADEVAVAPLSATVLRMAAGSVGIVLIAICTGKVRATVRATRDRKAMLATAIGMVFGPVLGVWMSVVAVDGADAGIAATLMSLAPVLMIPIARVAYGARAGARGIYGTFVAVGGGVLLLVQSGS